MVTKNLMQLYFFKFKGLWGAWGLWGLWVLWGLWGVSGLLIICDDKSNKKDFILLYGDCFVALF